MIEPCTKMLKQCYFQLNCLSALKWSIFAVSEGNLDFLDFLQKKFHNTNYWTQFFEEKFLRKICSF